MGGPIVGLTHDPTCTSRVRESIRPSIHSALSALAASAAVGSRMVEVYRNGVCSSNDTQDVEQLVVLIRQSVTPISQILSSTARWVPPPTRNDEVR